MSTAQMTSLDRITDVIIQKSNIILVGLMGSGKTTIGKLLAKRIGMPFFDSDQEIELRCGVKVRTIFDVEGEGGFRQRETATIEDLLQLSGIVLATGGGAVLDPRNRAVMKERGWVVYLDVPVRVLFERTRNDLNRPLLQVADPVARLEGLRSERDPLYREVADFVLDGGRHQSGNAVQRILKEWETRCET